MIVLLQTPDGGVRPGIVRPAHRLLAWLLADRLARALAAGCSPDSTELHALRAQALTEPHRRIVLAQSLLETRRAALARRPVSYRALPVCWDPVRLAQHELQQLGERVLSPGPVAVRGMAMVHLLVTDGAGPLYYARCPEELVAASNAALAALDPLSPDG